MDLTVTRAQNYTSNHATSPSSWHPFYREMRPYWEMAEDIKKGTPAIKEATIKYLPQEPKEKDQNYLQRLNRAIFHNISSKTISSLVGLGLRRSVTLGTDAPDKLKDMVDDVDLCGSNLDQFVQEVLEESIWKGHTFIWVDLQDAPDVRTKEAFKNSQVRPYFVHIAPEQVVNWRHTSIKGRQILTMVSTLEPVEEEDGAFGSKVVPYHRVYRLVTDDEGTPYVKWELYNQEDSIVEEGIVANTDEIPLYPVYSRKVDTFKSVPMLLDMYYLNIRHYQVASDRSYHLHLCAVPFLELKGRVDTSDMIIIAPNTAIDIPADGGIRWVELEGKTLDAQLKELQSLEMRMYTIGISTFGRQAVERRTATEASQDFFTANSDLHRVLRNLKNSLERAFDTAAGMLFIKNRGGLNLSIDYDFLGVNPQELQAMYDAYDRTLLPAEEVTKYLVRKQLTSDEYDPVNPVGTFKPEKEQMIAEMVAVDDASVGDDDS